MGCICSPNFSFVTVEFGKLVSFVYAAAQIKQSDFGLGWSDSEISAEMCGNTNSELACLSQFAIP